MMNRPRTILGVTVFALFCVPPAAVWGASPEWIIPDHSEAGSVHYRGNRDASGSEGVHYRRVTVTFDHSEFRMDGPENGPVIVTSDAPHDFYPSDPGYPALPMRQVNVLVPGSAEFENLKAEKEEELFTGGIRLSVVPREIPFNRNAARLYNRPNKAFDGAKVPPLAGYTGTHIKRGYRWFSFAVSPFRYDSESRELFLAHRLTLKVAYRTNPEEEVPVKPGPDVLRQVSELVDNPGDLDGDYPRDRASALKSAEDKLDYLIVTTRELKPWFEPLLEWKFRKGLKVDIVTLEEIDATYQAETPQLRIKQSLHDQYVNRDLEWVLLGGDAGVVPVQPCYTKIYLSGTEMVDESVPTDLFYACFDQRFDWNSTRDDNIGELYWDNNDLFPEIYLTRIPVRTAEDVKVFVNKVLSYERKPFIDDSPEKMLLSGIKSWNIWNGKSDNHHRSELMFRNHISPGWKGDKVGFYDTGTDLQEGEDYNVTAENLRNLLDSGFGIFHFAGHGNLDSYLMETGLSFGISDAEQLVNNHYSVMLSTTCDVNAFDSIDPCLSEALLRNPDGGAVAFYGSSRYGFGLTGQESVLGSSFRYNASLLDYMIRKDPLLHGNSFGRLAADSKAKFVFNGASGGVYQYLQYALNPMGDPEMPVYSGRPETFDNVRIYRWENSLTVNTGGITGCKIALTGQNMEDGYQVVAENTEFHTFTDVPDRYQVVITRPNYIPYRYYSSATTGTGDDILEKVNLYPNPARDVVYVEAGFPQAGFRLYDVHGRCLMTQDLRPGTSGISLEGLTDGTYIVRIVTAGGTGNLRLLIQGSWQ